MAAPIACVWNSCRISSPPVVSCSYGCYEIDEDDVKKLKEVLQVIQTSQSIALHLSSEQYTMSRMLYKLNNQQRQWKYYQMLQKTHKCLIKLQANHPAKFIDDAACCCQINHDQDHSETTIHLPSRQMLEFILTKLMGQAKLCAYILNLAEIVFVLVVQILVAGQFVSQNTVFATIVSRVWVVMRSMLKDIMSWYGDLRPWVDRLKAMPMQWMPEGEVLPHSLQEWLKADYDPTKYTMAIKQSSKRMSSSLLDSMFTASQVTSDLLPDKQPEDENRDAAETSTPTLDLGEPVKMDKKVNFKRKRSTSESQSSPPQKKPRQEAESAPQETSASNTMTDTLFSYMWKRGKNHIQPQAGDTPPSKVEQIEELLKRVHAEETRLGMPRTPNLKEFDLTKKKIKVQRSKMKHKLTKKLERLLKMAGQKGGTDRLNGKANRLPERDLKNVVLATLSKAGEPKTAKDREQNGGVEKNALKPEKKLKDSHVVSKAVKETTETLFPNTARNLDKNITKKAKKQQTTREGPSEETGLLKNLKKRKKEKHIMMTEKSQTTEKKIKNVAEGAAELFKTRHSKMVTKVGKDSNSPISSIMSDIKQKTKNSEQKKSAISSVKNEDKPEVGLAYRNKKKNNLERTCVPEEDGLINSSMDDVISSSFEEEHLPVKTKRSRKHKVKTPSSDVEETKHSREHKNIIKRKNKMRNDDVISSSFEEEHLAVKKKRSRKHKVKTSSSDVEETKHSREHKNIKKRKDKMRNITNFNGKTKTEPQAKLTRFSGGTSSKLKKTRMESSKSALVCELGGMLTSGPDNVPSDNASDIDGIFACLD